MRNFVLCLLFAILLIPQAAFSNDNFIYSINVTRSGDGIHLGVKSDYKTKAVSKMDNLGREYFDIKDASLKENFSILYNNANGVESVIAQEIGNKVRVYINADGIKNTVIDFNNVETQPYPDKSAGYALMVFGITIFGIFRLFKRKTRKLGARTAKTAGIQNATSKMVYNELMQRKRAAKNIKSIEEYQKQRYSNNVAMRVKI